MIERVSVKSRNEIQTIGLLTPYDEFLKVVDKLNELIDAFNEHFHETLDTHYNTTNYKLDEEK